MVAVKRGREEISISGRNLDEIQKQLDKLKEQQERTQNENLDEISSRESRTTTDGITTQENSSQSGIFSVDRVSQTKTVENVANDDSSTEQENPDGEQTPIDYLTEQENILTTLSTERDALLVERNLRRGVETNYKELHKAYMNDYDALTVKEREYRRWEMSALETFDDKEREKKLRANLALIKKHQTIIDEIKISRERENRIGTKRNRELYEQEQQEPTAPFESIPIYATFDDFRDDMSAITDDEYYFEREPLPVEHLDEIELQTFLKDVRKEYRRRFGRSLRDYNIVGNKQSKKVLNQPNTRNLQRIGSIGQYGSPQQPKSLSAPVVSVNVDEVKQRHKRARTEEVN